jgi:hypothetical protein
VVFVATAGPFAAAGEEHQIVDVVPRLDDVEPFVNLTTQFLSIRIAWSRFEGFRN